MERRQFLKLSICALAGAHLSLKQIGWLIEQAKEPENIGIGEFQKYVVSEINNLPDRKVGRVVKIETLRNPSSFGESIRGLNVSEYHKKTKYWSCLIDTETLKDLDKRKSFVKDMAKQLEIAFNH